MIIRKRPLFFDVGGGGGGGKIWNKLFVEAVNTEINCIVKKVFPAGIEYRGPEGADPVKSFLFGRREL